MGSDISVRASRSAPPFPRAVLKDDRVQTEHTITQSFFESRLPSRDWPRLAVADRRSIDPVYASHRWWARRPPGVMRGLILAAALSDSASEAEYWRLFANSSPPLSGLTVHDMFAGGGTTLVEAARLGAVVSGTDVDPLAIEIVRHQLASLDADVLASAGDELLAFVSERTKLLFASKNAKWTPLHYFWLHCVSCPDCGRESPLYRGLVLARDRGKNGGVGRTSGTIAFCPRCFRVHQLECADRKELRCCERFKLHEGNFSAQKFICAYCGAKSSHEKLRTGLAPRRLIAVEETAKDEYRRIRRATPADERISQLGEHFVQKHRRDLTIPTTDFERNRRDQRPLSFGLTKPAQLFTGRQLAVFGTAFTWINKCTYPETVRRALRLALSNALATNNRLCSYAVDYGRLAPLFSVRSYSLPRLPVELNPFHPDCGRGTLRRSLEKIVRSGRGRVRRHVWSTTAQKAIPNEYHFVSNIQGTATCVSAQEEAGFTSPLIDLCIFDPPYFDYIPYSELSEFYRSWLDLPRLGGTPLLPDSRDPVGSFATTLARVLIAMLAHLRPGRLLIFTFHSTDPDAWESIGNALDQANLKVTSVWPLKNDSHMGHHSAKGNCEWDLAIGCRPSDACRAATPKWDIKQWKKHSHPLKISRADSISMKMALAMAEKRHAVLAE